MTAEPSRKAANLLQKAAHRLPALPKTIRYVDDFDESPKKIEDFKACEVVRIYVYGSRVKIRLNEAAPELEPFFRHHLAYLLLSDKAVSTATRYTQDLLEIDPEFLKEVIVAGPIKTKRNWNILLNNYTKPETFAALSSLFGFLCKNSVLEWTPLFLDLISSLPYPFRDKYTAARNPNSYLSSEEEASIVSHLDSMSSDSVHLLIDNKRLEASCMLACAFLHGMRPLQIALLKLQDIRIWQDEEQSDTVHLTYQSVKQHSSSRSFRMTRKISKKWAPLFIDLVSRRKKQSNRNSVRLYDISNVGQVISQISALASELAGRDISATHLRHTAAQRLVDAGANQEELSEFLGHTDITSCLIYYKTSNTQAERVNKALGISEIYTTVTKIAREKFINESELASLKSDMQIGGIPHGIPISGIGGCSSGQSSCQFNPISSCYGCDKFLPLANIELHKDTLRNFRSVVKIFEKSAGHNTSSPTFLQLHRTISEIQNIIAALEATYE